MHIIHLHILIFYLAYKSVIAELCARHSANNALHFQESELLFEGNIGVHCLLWAKCDLLVSVGLQKTGRADIFCLILTDALPSLMRSLIGSD